MYYSDLTLTRVEMSAQTLIAPWLLCVFVVLTQWIIKMGTASSCVFLECCTLSYVQKVTEVVVWRMNKEGLRKKFKSWLLSHLCAPGQSLRKVDLADGLSVFERYKSCRTQLGPPGSAFRKRVSDAVSASSEAYWDLFKAVDSLFSLITITTAVWMYGHCGHEKRKKWL